MLHEKIIDIEDSIIRIKQLREGITGLRVIVFYSDNQIEAKDFAPMLEQIELNMNKEITTLKSQVKELSNGGAA